MGRALIAVGTALALLVGGLALAVYVTRDEDNITSDNILSEEFTRDIQLAEARQADVDLRELAPFEWDRAPGVPRATISQRLGYEWTGTRNLDDGEIVILLRADGSIARFFDYRGLGEFRGFDKPIQELPRDRAVFRVTDLVITPKG